MERVYWMMCFPQVANHHGKSRVLSRMDVTLAFRDVGCLKERKVYSVR